MTDRPARNIGRRSALRLAAGSAFVLPALGRARAAEAPLAFRLSWI